MTMLINSKFKEEAASNLTTYCDSLSEGLINPSSVTELDLHYSGLKEWPEELKQFVNLEVLNLNGNEISSIPNSIEHLQNLRELKFCGNRIYKIPTSIFSLPLLTSLDFNCNILIWVEMDCQWEVLVNYVS
jgi:Leucine-rich repeat (LRR) protein